MTINKREFTSEIMKAFNKTQKEYRECQRQKRGDGLWIFQTLRSISKMLKNAV